MSRETITDFRGRNIAYIETDSQGNKVVYDFYKRILGKYDARADRTYDFYGRIIAHGDGTGILISQQTAVPNV